MTAFLLAVGVIFLAAAACGSIAARLSLPRVVGEMAAGLILGQSLLGHVWPSAESYLFGDEVLDALRLVGLLVVLLYVALVGAELDWTVLRGQSRGIAGAVAVGLLSAICGGAVIALAFSDLEPQGVPLWAYLVFLTGALLVTAVPVLARILDETGLTRTRVGAVTLTLSIADDLVAFSIIAMAIAVATNGNLALAVAGTTLLLALAAGSRVADGVRRRLSDTPALSALGIGAFALVVAATGALGASTLVAAFILGAVVWRPGAPTDALPGGNVIRALVPLYIVYAALSVDLSRLAIPRLAFAVLLTMVLAVLTKTVACLVAGRILSLSRHETIGLAVLRNTRGLTELVALNLGYQAGLLSQDLYTVFFSMALLTTAASGAIAMAALRTSARGGEPEVEALLSITVRRPDREGAGV